MPSHHLEFLGSYDLFGKSVPGAIFLIGFYSLFPRDQIVIPQSGGRFVDIISLLVVLLLLGLMIGQGVHTLADNFEKVFLKLGIWLTRISRTLYVEGARLMNWYRRSAKKYWNGGKRIILILFMVSFFPLTFIVLLNLLLKFIMDLLLAAMICIFPERWFDIYDTIRLGWGIWWKNRYWGLYDSLIGHRYLFGKSIEWNYAGDNPERWEEKEKEELYDRFILAYLNAYDVDMRRKVPYENANRYPLITARLTHRGDAQYRHFQSLYSFCRSMWVVFLLLGLAHLAMYLALFQFGTISLNSLPLSFYALSGYELYLPLILLATSAMFLDASGTYKRHYIEYMIAEFSILEEFNDDLAMTYRQSLLEEHS
ncbi:hypothetical protein [Halovivax limisalsi]|uniref:hypothetical protein n=1 Tax=Halovivax limisalsi TaxID=1453760 RepID=UPI001FFD8B08|nr:hypothetical protein [Halovivax limisalsi]